MKALPERLENDIAALTGCASGAASVEFIRDWLPGAGVEDHVASATVEAVKPGGAKSCCGRSCCAPERA